MLTIMLDLQVCVQDFCEELEYWGLDDLHMEPCCQHTYYRARWLLPEAPTDEEVEDNFGEGCCSPTQKQLWNLFENPHHSRAAKVNKVIASPWHKKSRCFHSMPGG